MAVRYAQSIRTLLPSLPVPHLYVDVVLAVLYHTDVGFVDGLLVVFNASRPVSSRADHLESKRETPSALSLQAAPWHLNYPQARLFPGTARLSLNKAASAMFILPL